jgi:FkbM family methyltransferase
VSQAIAKTRERPEDRKMKSFFKKISKLSKEGQLTRTFIYKILMKIGIGRLFSFTTQGLRLRLFPSDMTFEAWKSPDNYRTGDKKFLEQVLKPGGLVVDVGANIGMISIRSAKLVGNSGRVIAIEPNPNIAPFCKENIWLNGVKNVTVFQTALGAHEGMTSFNCDRSDDCSRVIEKGGVEVPITLLDKVMEMEPTREIDLLKVDVEGYEFVVLEGAVKSLKRTRLIYIEVDAANYSHYGRRTEEMIDLLNSHGFDTFVSDEDGKWSEVTGTITGSVNVIGKKRSERAAKDSPSPVLASHS